MENNITIPEIGLPDYMTNATPELKGFWLQRERLKVESDKHPLRFLSVTNYEAEEIVIDCKASYAAIKSQVTTHCGTGTKMKDYVTSILLETSKIRDFYQINYFTKVSMLSRKINQLMGQQMDIGVLDLKKLEVLDMLGKFYTFEEVHKVITKKWGYVMPLHNIAKWSKQFEPEIDKRKAEYILRHKDFRIATDTGRLEVLNQQLSHWQDKFDELGAENASNMVLKILEQARREVKGNELHLTIDGKIDINATIQAHNNIMEISQRLPINMLVVGLTAAKQGLNPLNIMTALATSYYSVHNGFNGRLTGDEEIQPPINLIKNYNWIDMEQKHNRYREANREKGIMDIIEISDPVEQVKAKKTKAELLESLKELGKKVNT